MATKEDLSDKLNELLDMDIDWSKLTKEDLDVLMKFFEDPMQIFKFALQNIKNIRNKATQELLNRPVKDFLTNLETNDDKGIIGLGIFPSGGLGILSKVQNFSSNLTEKHKDKNQS